MASVGVLLIETLPGESASPAAAWPASTPGDAAIVGGSQLGRVPPQPSRRQPVLPQVTSTPRGPERDREDIELRLSNSGSSAAPWTGEVRGAITQALVSLRASGNAGFRASAVDCYSVGCIVHLQYDDERQFEHVQDELIDGGSLGAWSRMTTGPEVLSNGRMSNVLVVFRPPTDEEVELAETKRRERFGKSH